MSCQTWLRFRIFVGFVVLTGTSHVSRAQGSIKAEAGYTQVGDVNALGLNLGAGWSITRFHLTVTPVDVFFVPNNSSGLYTQIQRNGQSVCRNSGNGQYATTPSCAPQGYYAGQADVIAEFGSPNVPVGVGGGYRIGYSHGVPNTGYGTLMIGRRVDRITYFSRGNVAPDFFQFNVGVSLRVGN